MLFIAQKRRCCVVRLGEILYQQTFQKKIEIKYRKKQPAIKMVKNKILTKTKIIGTKNI
jgi:hypothetical protein